MKIRNGFVSNSSSGSFIFPKSMSCDEVEEKLNLLIDFANKVKPNANYTFYSIFDCVFPMDENYIQMFGNKLPEFEEIGRRGLIEEYVGACIVDTAHDNSVPYWMNNLLCELFGATYIHHGG